MRRFMKCTLIGLNVLVLCVILNTISKDWKKQEIPRNKTSGITTITKLSANAGHLQTLPAKPSGHFFLCKDLIGGFGNLLFQYASLYGIARSKGMIPLIDANNKINKLFNLWALKRTRVKKTTSICDGMHHHGEKRSSAFDEATVSFPENTDIRLHGYLQSFMYFNKSEDELRLQFKFQQSVLDKARQVLNGFIVNAKGAEGVANTVNSKNTITLVAVHVRRGDKLSEVNQNLGMTVASKDYIIRAQDYFNRKYKNVVFVVCSDDMRWCFENLPKNRTMFLDGQDAITDLAIMSQCHHSILTVGTFGWWVGWLVNGDTVYYQRRITEGSPVSKQWVMSHHFPPHWIPML